MGEEDKEEKKEEAKAALAQKKYPYIEGGPPEDPVFPPVCTYHKSEDGTSCDKVVVPCQESGEVPQLKGCPAREVTSSRKAEAPVVKKEAPLPDMPPGAKKEP